MQIIANKTKLETASMHVITIVTLLFLPATFVAVSLTSTSPDPKAPHYNAS